jgi:hypothetical protein
MTDIDPRAHIELSTADGHVIARVPLAGPVTEEWLRCYERLARAMDVPVQAQHILAGPGSSSACPPVVTTGKWRRRWTLPAP